MRPLEPEQDQPTPLQSDSIDAIPQFNDQAELIPHADTPVEDPEINSPPTTDGQTTIHKTDERLPIFQSLGLFGCCIIIGGSGLLLPVMGFLLFLWTGGNPATGGQDAPKFWRTIMLNDWAVRSITLSSLVLRLITASQTTICTSLSAALLIERRRMPTSKVALLSIFRGVNDGPLRLFKELFWSKPIAGTFYLETISLVVLALASLAIQFSSTILLSDLSTTALVQYPKQIRSNVGMLMGAIEAAQNSNGEALPFAFGPYQVFGELEMANAAAPNDRGVSDTGLRSRAFLPFDQDNRTTLRSFKGPTAAITTRISCIAPSIESPILRMLEMGTMVYAEITGTISYDDTFKNAGLNHSRTCAEDKVPYNQTTCLPTKVACSILLGNDMTDAESYTEYPASLCRLPVPVIETENGAIGFWSTDADMWDANTVWPFLTLATNAKQDFLVQMGESGIDTLPLRAPSPYGEWNSYKLAENIFLNATLCSAGLFMGLADVEMSTTADPREPEVVMGVNGSSAIKEVQDLLVAAPFNRSPSERGLLSVDVMRYVEPNSTVSSSTSHPLALTRGDMDADEFELFLHNNSVLLWGGPATAVVNWGRSANLSLSTCSPCQGVGTALSDDSGSLFTRIINTTNRAAIAIETLLFHISSIWYYRIHPLFDYPTTIEVAFSGQFSVPTYWNGMVAVISIVLVHLVCVWVITGLYVARVRYTRQGNIWHAVSQLLSKQTEAILEQSNEIKDDDVSKLIRKKDPWVIMGRSETGRVEVLKCED